ncbi:MAG: single-stranded-DNA-specific exonuclease RecJ [Clostridiales Family XIII bacterium]|jgi:single-stranded-DNA-specific exonuclease|nr:single-stranded-DNA-specific exonuclease RecJ [Clostridiales Family XIII bacterium]
MRSAREIIEHILAERGILAPEDVEEFLSDKPKRTYDPFLLPDMEAGVDLIYSFLQQGKHICVYGDYDADGVMSTALLCRYFRALPGARSEISYYIPSRFDEGYGPSENAFRSIKERGAKLVVTVDCGSVSKSEVAYAQSIGLTVLVTDHHDCAPERMPDCLIINPRRADSAYPQRGLSGCGVAFKVAQAMKQRHYEGVSSVAAALNASLDLTAIATITDVMPLADENRTLVKYGLTSINRGDRPALKNLIDAIGLKAGQITAYNIAFGIGPHINAAGRMSDAASAVELFLTEDADEMDVIVAELVRRNDERRALQERLVDSCVEMIDARDGDDRFLVICPPGIHEGVAGIVAGRVKDRYGLPTAILSESDADGKPLLKGSVRGVPGVDVITMLKKHGELFLKLGGHAMAAGFTMPAERDETLRALLNADVEALLAENPQLLDRKPAVATDAAAAEITLELAEWMRKFEPTGAGNPKPLFRLSDVSVSNVKRMGSERQHMRFVAGGVPCVLFGASDEYADRIADGTPVSLVGVVEVNSWNGVDSVQFIVREID